MFTNIVYINVLLYEDIKIIVIEGFVPHTNYGIVFMHFKTI